MQQMYDSMRNFFYVVAGLALITMSCSPNNVKQDKLSAKKFKDKNIEGSFVLLNNADDNFNVYNLSDYRDSAYAPGTTFDIVNVMIALETGAITDENSILYQADSSATLKKSFEKNSVFFDSLAIRTGKDHLQFWLDSLHYGKTKINENITSFWKDGSLKLTADEHLGLIKAFYFAQLPFQKRTQAIAKKLLQKESNTKYTLAYNKGISRQNGYFCSIITGWIIENKHVYFFSLTAKNSDKATLEATTEPLLKEILKEQGFFEGRK